MTPVHYCAQCARPWNAYLCIKRISSVGYFTFVELFQRNFRYELKLAFAQDRNCSFVHLSANRHTHYKLNAVRNGNLYYKLRREYIIVRHENSVCSRFALWIVLCQRIGHVSHRMLFNGRSFPFHLLLIYDHASEASQNIFCHSAIRCNDVCAQAHIVHCFRFATSIMDVSVCL